MTEKLAEAQKYSFRALVNSKGGGPAVASSTFKASSNTTGTGTAALAGLRLGMSTFGGAQNAGATSGLFTMGAVTMQPAAAPSDLKESLNQRSEGGSSNQKTRLDFSQRQNLVSGRFTRHGLTGGLTVPEEASKEDKNDTDQATEEQLASI